MHPRVCTSLLIGDVYAPVCEHFFFYFVMRFTDACMKMAQQITEYFEILFVMLLGIFFPLLFYG